MEITETNKSELSILKPFDIQKEELHKLVGDYVNLLVTEETLDEAIKARRVLWDIIIKAEKVLKENKSILNAMKGEQEAKADEFISIVSPTKERIDADIKAIEQKKKDEKALKEKEAMIKIANRTSILHELGVKVIGSNYSLGEHSIEAVQIKIYSDIEFNQFVELIKTEALIIENQRIEEENRRKELELQLENQRKEQEVERKRLEDVAKEQEKKQVAMFAEQERINKEAIKQRLEAEKALAEREDAFKKEKEALEESLRKKQEDILNAIKHQRIKQLDSIGLVFDVSKESFVFEDVNVSMVEIITTEESEWIKLIEGSIHTIEERKKEAEEKRLEQLASEKKERLAKEKLDKKRQEILKKDIEHLEAIALIFEEAGDNTHDKFLNDPKSVQIASDVQKMNQGIVEFIRQSIKNL